MTIIAEKNPTIKSTPPDPSSATLGKSAGIAATGLKNSTRNYRHLADAQHFLIHHNVLNTVGKKHRTRTCHAVRHKNAQSITLKLSVNKDISRASLCGLQTCGSPWACPVCAARLAVKRGREIALALEWAEKENCLPLMISMTARHDDTMTLSDFKERFKAAWRYFARDGSWKRLKKNLGIDNSIKVVECTRGNHGWHYHQHGLLFASKKAIAKLNKNELAGWQSKAATVWLRCLERVGLSGISKIAFHVTYHGNVKATYLSKVGLKADDETNARHELSGGMNKRSGRTIWQILRSAASGSKRDELLYIEFVSEMQGDNWINWSPGFKAIVGVDEATDETLAETEPDEQLVFADWLPLSDDDYAPIRKIRAYSELLEIAASTRSKRAVKQYLRWVKQTLNDQTGEALADLWLQYQRAHDEWEWYRRYGNRIGRWDNSQVDTLNSLWADMQQLKTTLENAGEHVS